MTTTKTTAKIITREARKDFADIQRTIQDWNDMADECQRQGYRPQYCIHGTNTWTDYDNICPGCEDGIYPQDITYMDVLKDVLAEYRVVQKRLKANTVNFAKLGETFSAMGMSELGSDTIMKALNEILGRFTY